MRKVTFFLLIMLGVAFFITTFMASAVVGSYIINDPHIENHIVFTETPIETTNISDVDKVLYSFKISAYPYLSALSLIFLLSITIYFYRNNREKKNHT